MDDLFEALKAKAQEGNLDNLKTCSSLQNTPLAKDPLDISLNELPSKNTTPASETPYTDQQRTYFKSINQNHKRGDDLVYEHFQSKTDKHKRTRTD